MKAKKTILLLYSRIVRTLNFSLILGEKNCALYAGNYGNYKSILGKAGMAIIVTITTPSLLGGNYKSILGKAGMAITVTITIPSLMGGNYKSILGKAGMAIYAAITIPSLLGGNYKSILGKQAWLSL